MAALDAELVTDEALLLGVETRTSSPCRLVRGPQDLQSPGITGLYPAWHGCWAIGVKLPEDVPTAGDLFQQQGPWVMLGEEKETQPVALQLRYLQTMLAISGDKNATVIVPLPLEIIKPFLAAHEKEAPKV